VFPMELYKVGAVIGLRTLRLQRLNPLRQGEALVVRKRRRTQSIQPPLNW